MKTRNFFLFLSLLGMFSACSPKVVTKSFQHYSPRQAYEGLIVFLPEDSIQFTDQEIIGEIRVGDSGISTDCSFETVVDFAKANALQLGANAIKIYQHRPPNVLWSTCHQIRAKALLLKDIRPYEKQIIWDARRKLTVADFKGDTLNRPFQAATCSQFNYRYRGRLINGYVTFNVDTYFDCFCSYLKPDANSQALLEHEQIHFDISEIYARRFVQRIGAEIASVEELELEGKKIMSAIFLEMQKQQDLYDSEVYSNGARQKFWLEKTQKELQELQALASKELRIPYKAKKQN